MAILSSRSESIVTVEAKANGVRTGLVWWGKNGSGVGQESHRQVLVADRSFSVLGKATSATATAAKLIAMATNTREDNTGV